MKKYLIGGLGFAFDGCKSDFPGELELFRNDSIREDYLVSVSYSAHMPDGGTLFNHERTGRPLMCVAEKGAEISVTVSAEYPGCFGLRLLLDVLRLPSRIISHGGIFLHASFICVKGGAVLFTGRKQSGKSTQAALWHDLRGSVTVNGDRALLRKTNGVWTAFGSPYSGTSGISLNMSCPVRCIVSVVKSPENICLPASPGKAFRALLEGCTYDTGNEKETAAAVDVMSGIANETDFYELRCRPDSGSVEALERMIF